MKYLFISDEKKSRQISFYNCSFFMVSMSYMSKTLIKPKFISNNTIQAVSLADVDKLGLTNLSS